MATGFPTAYAIEIEFTAGVWTDVSADVARDVGVTRMFGRVREGEDVGPGSCDFTLKESTGKYVPDNPVSPYYPNVVERKRVRFTVTKGSARVRFLGYIASWRPVLPAGGSAADGYVEVTAVTFDGIASRPLWSAWTERALMTAADGVFVFTGGEGKTGEACTNVVPGATIEAYKTSSRTNGTGQVVSPDRLFLEGAFEYTPTSGVGPVWTVPIADTEWDFQFWFKLESAVASTKMLVHAPEANGLSGSSDASTIRLVVGASGTDLDIDGFLTVNNVDDGRWYRVRYASNTTSPFSRDISIAVAPEGSSETTLDTSSGSMALPAAWWTFGGKMTLANKVSQVAPVQIAGIVFNAGELIPADSGGPRFGDPIAIDTWLDEVDTWLGVTGTTTGSDNPTVRPLSTWQRSYAQVRQSAAKAVGAIAWVNPQGTSELRLSDSVRTATPVLTLTLQDDSDGTFELAREVDGIPTRATITYPSGAVTVIDTDAEAGGVSRDAATEADSRNAAQARYLAQFMLSEAAALRITRVTVNLAASPTDLYSSVASLYPGARVRITGLPSDWLGYTQADVIVQGWTEVDRLDGVWLTIDCTPADSPRQGLVDTDRVAATDSTLTSTITSSDTSVAVTIGASGETWSTAAGDYPLKIRIGGEIISLPSAPASGSAPSWTGVTRGVDGTTAIAHTAGASVQVHFPMTVGMG